MARFWPGGADLVVARFEATQLGWRAPATRLFISGTAAGSGGGGGHTADPGGGGGGGAPGWAVDFAAVSVVEGTLLDIIIGAATAGAAAGGGAPASAGASLIIGLRDGIENGQFRLIGGSAAGMTSGNATTGGNGGGFSGFGPGAVGGAGAGPQGSVDAVSIRGFSYVIGRAAAGGAPGFAGGSSTSRMYANAPTGGALSGTQGGGGAGGYGPFGRGGNGGPAGTVGGTPTGFGGGGGGGGCLAAGGPGAPGFIEIAWFE